MSASLPILRDTRRFDLAAEVGQTVFTFPRPLAEGADLRVLQRSDPAARFEPVSGAFTVTPAADHTSAVVTFAAPPRPSAAMPAMTIRLDGARLTSRTTDVTRAGVIMSSLLERELDLLAMIVQELRRDLNDVGPDVFDAAAAAIHAATTAVADVQATLSGMVSTATSAAGTATAAASAAAESAARAGLIDPSSYYTKTAADDRFLPLTRQILGGGLASGGGGLDADRTITVSAATPADVRTGTEAGKAITPASVANAMNWIALADAATLAIDHAAGVNRQVTLAGNRVVANPTNPRPGWPLNLFVIQDSVGARVLTWGSLFAFGTKGPPALPTVPTAWIMLSFVCVPGGYFLYLGMTRSN